MPDPKPGKVRKGSVVRYSGQNFIEEKPASKSRMIIKHKGGTQVVRKDDNYVGEESLSESRQIAAGSGTGHYTSQASPRTGGTAMPATGTPSGGTRKQIRMSKVRVKKSAASPQAKRSASMLYR